MARGGFVLEGVHFSVDDVCAGLAAGFDPDDRRPAHPAMRFVEEVHDQLGLPVDLYLFYSDTGPHGNSRLPAVTLAWKDWFNQHPLIRLGPHALDRSTPPHSQSLDEQLATFVAIEGEIGRIVGEGNRSRWVRLHEFSECFEAAGWLKDHGIEALLTTDRPTVSWRLPADEARCLASSGSVRFRNIEFRRSDLRLESLAGLDPKEIEMRLVPLISRHRAAVVFTHEYELMRHEVRVAARHALEFLAVNLRGMAFPPSVEYGCNPAFRSLS